MSISEISPAEVFEKMAKGDHLQLIDVRETTERNAASIDNSIHMPLSKLADKASTLDKKKSVYVLCKSGQRANVAAKQIEKAGCQSVYVVKGGMDAWARNGLPVNGHVSKLWSMERQVRFSAGMLILMGILLSFAINMNWLLLSAVVALGMVVSSVLDTCGMATVLRMMPWNCERTG